MASEQSQAIRRASLSSAQVEEIYAKLEIHERQELAVWAKTESAKPAAERIVLMPEGAEGRPTSWQIRTLDTGRSAQFVFPKLTFQVVPNIDSTENLFKMSTFIFRAVAVPMAILLSRYERVQSGLVMALPAPLDCIIAFIESQKKQDILQLELQAATQTKTEQDDDSDSDDEVEQSSSSESVAGLQSNAQTQQEAKALKEMWESRGVEPSLLRSFTHTIFKQRAELDLPFAVFYSLTDNDFCVALFWHGSVLAPFAESIPGFQRKSVRLWPIHDHNAATEAPEVMCERPGCPRSSGPPANKDLLLTFDKHLSARDIDQKKLTINRVREKWRVELEPAMHQELAQLDDDQTDEDEKEILKKRDDIVSKYAKKVDDLEKAMIADEKKRAFVPLSRCARCKIASYCCRACQQDDWPRHKPVCKQVQ